MSTAIPQKCWIANVDRTERVVITMLVALKNLRTEIEGDVKDAVDSLSESRGMSIRAITERTFAWLCDQPDEIQAVVLGQIPADADFLQVVVARMADRAIRSATVNKAGRAELPPRVGVRGTPPKPAQPSTSGAHATAKHPPK